MDVLLHFRDMPDLPKFGMIGFHRLNGRDNSKRAYKRTHVVSTVLLNLNKLSGIDYHWRAHVWEDHQFNRDVEDVKLNRDAARRAVICKCYRFAFSSPQLRGGGCEYIVARAQKEEVDLDDVGSEVLTEEPDIAVHEGSSIQEVARWIRSIDLLDKHAAEECAQTFEKQEIDGYILFNVLNWHILKEMGLTVGRRGKILNAINAMRAGAANSSVVAVGAASSSDTRGSSSAPSGQRAAVQSAGAGGRQAGSRSADSPPLKKQVKTREGGDSDGLTQSATAGSDDDDIGADHDQRASQESDSLEY